MNEGEADAFQAFNFSMEELGSREMVNSWNIKDPIQYKLDLTTSHEPEFWQWIPEGQIIYSKCGRSRYLIDNEVVKTFT